MNLYELGVKLAYDPDLQRQLDTEVADLEKPNYAMRKLPQFIYDQARDQAAFIRTAPANTADVADDVASLSRLGKFKSWAAKGVNPLGTALEALALATPGKHYRSSFSNPVAENNVQRPAAFVAKYAPWLGQKIPTISPVANAVGRAAEPFNQTGGFVNAYRYLRHDVADGPVRGLLRKLPWLNSRISEVSKVPEAMRGARALGMSKLPTAGLAAYGSYALGDLAYTLAEISRGNRNLYDDTLRQSNQGLLQNWTENLLGPGGAFLQYMTDDGRLNSTAASNVMLGPAPAIISGFTREFMRSRNLDKQLEAVKLRAALRQSNTSVADNFKQVLRNAQQGGKSFLSALAPAGETAKRVIPTRP